MTADAPGPARDREPGRVGERFAPGESPTGGDVGVGADVPSGSGIGVGEALAELRAGAVLVDVRTPNEYRTAHAQPAIHIQLGWLATDVPAQVPGRTIVTICSYGNRASQAAAQLAADGYRAFFVRGGLAAWREAGERVVSTPRSR
ncbi:rhodanese-like domain-containing protein [Propionicicella superfundia]|uniref:rhodanese-like domain-containing protein n=1 Tax=Propionicicella superfundia TaxID=348582 RepID=UPI0006883A98|nr:rhodanese-like domain-containing protein [Propionicicella superfundia]